MNVSRTPQAQVPFIPTQMKTDVKMAVITLMMEAVQTSETSVNSPQVKPDLSYR
jgi:hypothetical protein